MSFSMTKAQLLDGSKTVTRRLGWKTLKAGDQVLAVSKVMGMKKGERAKIYGIVAVLSVRRERLDRISAADVAAEGYPSLTVADFLFKFTAAMRCRTDDEVTRIEFTFVPTQKDLDL